MGHIASKEDTLCGGDGIGKLEGRCDVCGGANEFIYVCDLCGNTYCSEACCVADDHMYTDLYLTKRKPKKNESTKVCSICGHVGSVYRSDSNPDKWFCSLKCGDISNARSST